MAAGHARRRHVLQDRPAERNHDRRKPATSPEETVTLPAAQARQALELLLACEHVISALRARGLKRDLGPDDPGQLAALLTGGDAARLAARLDAAGRDLAAAFPVPGRS